MIEIYCFVISVFSRDQILWYMLCCVVTVFLHEKHILCTWSWFSGVNVPHSLKVKLIVASCTNYLPLSGVGRVVFFCIFRWFFCHHEYHYNQVSYTVFVFCFFHFWFVRVCSLSFYNYILTLIGSFALLRIGYKIRSTDIDAKQKKCRIWNTAGQEPFRTSRTGMILGQQVSSSYWYIWLVLVYSLPVDLYTTYVWKLWWQFVSCKCFLDV